MVMSSGNRIQAPKRVKGGTSSTRKHRFQSFNQRISKLRIDPVRRSRPVNLDRTAFDEKASYFKDALDRWKDLNLSEDFVDFVRVVQPICESLPQVIHHQQKIIGTIIRHLEKRDVLSLEPLLELLASFAHDLGAQFENHFGTAVTLVASLAATHPAVEVIEWSFTCLAWLFKYLSRLLVPDLRPLYQIMAPLLGREPQKTHTTQFAAEALSYLLRKSASSFHKNSIPLETILQHVLLDLGSMKARTEAVELYEHGLQTLFVNSIKGIEGKLHSCGAQVYRTFLEHVLDLSGTEQRRAAEVIYGVTVGLLHFTDAQGFHPILRIVVDSIAKLNLGSRDANVAICGRLVFIASTVRKGSRVAGWTSVLNALMSLLGLSDIAGDETFTQIYRAAAAILQISPLEVIHPHFDSIMGILAHERYAPYFLAFCNDFHDLGQERFQSLLFPHLIK